MITGWRVAARLLALLLLLPLAAFGAARPAPAVAGRLQVSADTRQPLALQGQWGFAWHRFVDPSWQQLPTEAFAPVPASWNDLAADGKEPGPNGWGSYVLQVDCPQGQVLAIEPVGQRTAARIFVNGVLVGAHGRPGPSRAESWAAVYNRIPISREFACPLRITVHLSNFDHRAGGFVRPMFVGTADALARARELRVAYDAGLTAVYALTGLVGLIFYAVRRRERTPLVFGLFCLAMAVYGDMIGERLLLRWLPPQVSWFQYMRVEYLSWIAAMALFVATLRALFPVEVGRGFFRAVEATLGVAAVGVLLLRPETYSYVALPGQAVAVLAGAYLALALARAQRHNRKDARVLLVGLLAVVVGLVVDLLLIDVPGPDRKFGPFGFALFLLSPAVVIARRMSHALNAEERNRTLEENARLREDVQRMSRHDLKTPLNSILGASRLLRDDTRLATDQRELVGVLQRAALRMLEMVNLSLGLFRMETGSYAFRPQAVDLREIVTRVLVDLQSYAEDNRVSLHVQGSDRTPVHARGEELLCYSIVANLVKNAIEATSPGGQVSVAVGGGEAATIAVHNPGEVPPAVAARFFEKYVTGGKSGGTGLGTYSARLMARVQEGDLALRTSAAEGTTVTLQLKPAKGELAPAALPEAQASHLAREMAALPARSVLLVDDDEFTRLVMRRFLPSPPFAVETAANGQAAMEAMARRWPDYLLVDMEMPRQGGIETVRWVREREAVHGRPRCRIVMWSGNDDQASLDRALATGADRFLVKPVSQDLLLATLRELEGGVPPQEAPVPVVPRAAEPPADVEDVVRVRAEWVEIFPEFLRGQLETLDAMGRAVAAGDREQVRFLAHRAAGGLFTLKVNWAAYECRRIDEDALQAPPDDLARRIAALRRQLGTVRFVAE